MRKSLRKTMAAIISAGALSAVFAVVGCGGGSENDAPLSSDDWSVPENATVEVGECFVPEIEARNGASVESVSLTDKLGMEETLAEDWSFTADEVGVYTYTVVIIRGSDRAEVKFTVSAQDETAPVIVAEIADRENVEIGYYDGFAADLASLQATDNCDASDRLSVQVTGISFGGESFLPNASGGFFFDEIGEYEVAVEVSDRSANAVTTSYTISTADTTAPEIKQPKTAFAWLGDGKISLPVPEVYEVGTYTLLASVRKNGEVFPVTDGTFDAAGAGEYVVSYTAEDVSGNESETVSFSLVVTEDGRVGNFGYEEELSLWQTSGAEKYFDTDGMVAYGSGNALLTKALTEKDWSGFNLLELEFENLKANAPTIGIYLDDGSGARKIFEIDLALAEISSDMVVSAGKTSAFSVDFTGYGLDTANIGTVYLQILSDDPYKLKLKNISLGTGEADTALPPAEEGTADIGFETNLSKSHLFNGGSEYTTDERYVLEGERSARYAVAAKSYTGERFSEIRAVDEANAIRLYVFSETYTRLQFTGIFDTTELSSEFFNLRAGWNRIEWYVGIENGFTLDEAGLSGLILRSDAEYPTVFYLDSVRFIQKDAFSADELFIESVSFGAEYGESFTVPSPLLGNGKQVVSLSAALFEGERTEADLSGESGYGFTDANSVVLYEKLSLERGRYTLAYLATDILGEEHLRVYPLIGERNTLSFSVNMPLLLNGEKYSLDDVSVSSDIYGEDELKDAVLEIYCKEDGKVNWNPLGESFEAEKAGFYQFRYVLTYDGVRTENIYREFVHEKGVTADFELVGEEHHGYGIDYSLKAAIDAGRYEEGQRVSLMTELSDEWANDGEYSVKYVMNVIGWGGFYLDEPFAASGENGFRVVINATQPTRGVRFSLRTEEGWVYSREVDIQSGVHTYTIRADYAGENTDDTVEFSRIEAFIFFIPYDPTKTYYFDTLSFVSVETDSVI